MCENASGWQHWSQIDVNRMKTWLNFLVALFSGGEKDRVCRSWTNVAE